MSYYLSIFLHCTALLHCTIRPLIYSYQNYMRHILTHQLFLPIYIIPNNKSLHISCFMLIKIFSKFVQLTGKIQSPTHVEVRIIHPIGDAFDTESYNGAVDLMHGKARALFM